MEIASEGEICMKIVFGAGEVAKEYIMNNYSSSIVCYDNDRRKWGKKVIDDVEIITLDELLKIIECNDCEIIVTPKSDTALYFLKDVCKNDDKVYRYADGSLDKIELDNLPEYSVDINAIESERIKRYELIKDTFKRNGDIVAYNHACEYLEYKRNNILAPELGGIELTNNCNLRCKNCPTPPCKREKGYMGDAVFNEAFKYISPDQDSYFSMHGLGEPLLHPKIFEYLDRVTSIKRPVILSTNGLLLDDTNIDSIMNTLNKTSKSRFYISFHSEKSVKNWIKCVDWMTEHKENRIELFGQVLEHNKDEALRWLRNCGISNPCDNKYIRFITSHSFAGNVSARRHEYSDIEVNNRFKNCYYVNSNIILMAWDGRFKSCCLDSEVCADRGSIYDIKNIRCSTHPYKLCHTCDPDWTSNFQ